MLSRPLACFTIPVIAFGRSAFAPTTSASVDISSSVSIIVMGGVPFSTIFKQLKARGASDTEMLAAYRRLHSSISDETQLRSWFRDQVLHPLESQHTLRELIPILDEGGFSVRATSINGFKPFDRLEDLFDLEAQLGTNRGAERTCPQRLLSRVFRVSCADSARNRVHRDADRFGNLPRQCSRCSSPR